MEKLKDITNIEDFNKIKLIIDKYPQYENMIIDYILTHHKKINGVNAKYDRGILKMNDYKLFDDISTILGIIFDKYNFNNEIGIFGKCLNNNNIIGDAVKSIREDGYYKFNFTLDEKKCNNIIKKLSNLKYKTKNGLLINGIQIKNPIGNAHWIVNQNDIANLREIQEIMTDPTILSICQEYLNTIPINMQTNSWWSCNHNNSDNTIRFHQDVEDIKFIKIFIYLNDIDINNGPHVYAKGSRNNLKFPKKYTISSRISDEFIKSNYQVKEITGKKGTILFVDTNGFHKGKKIIDGYRILCQLEFGSTYMFDQISLPRFKLKNTSNDIEEFIKKYKRIYYKYDIK